MQEFKNLKLKGVSLLRQKKVDLLMELHTQLTDSIEEIKETQKQIMKQQELATLFKVILDLQIHIEQGKATQEFIEFCCFVWQFL